MTRLIVSGGLCPESEASVLPPFIIDQIRRREEEEARRRHEFEQPRLELPEEAKRPTPEHREDEHAERGVVILDLG
jgi:hypothetical protein